MSTIVNLEINSQGKTMESFFEISKQSMKPFDVPVRITFMALF